MGRDATVTKGEGVHFGRKKAASCVTEFMNGSLRTKIAFFPNQTLAGGGTRNEIKQKQLPINAV